MKKLWYAVIVVVVIYLGWEFFRPRAGKMQSQTSTVGVIGTANLVDSVTGGSGEAASVVQLIPSTGPASVIYSADGFSPKNVTVKKGVAVMWTNVSAGGLQVAADNHPAHAGYDGTARTTHCVEGAPTSFDQCVTGAAGSQWSFTFNKVGVWSYHNHVNAIFGGTVTVTE